MGGWVGGWGGWWWVGGGWANSDEGSAVAGRAAVWLAGWLAGRLGRPLPDCWFGRRPLSFSKGRESGQRGDGRRACRDEAAEREKSAGSNVAVDEGAPPPTHHPAAAAILGSNARPLATAARSAERHRPGLGAEKEVCPPAACPLQKCAGLPTHVRHCRLLWMPTEFSEFFQTLVAVQGTVAEVDNAEFGASSPWFGPLMRHLTQLCKESKHMLVLFEEQQDKWYFRPAALARESARVDRLLQDAMGVIANARQGVKPTPQGALHTPEARTFWLSRVDPEGKVFELEIQRFQGNCR